MQPLHDDHFRARRRVIQAGGHCLIPPFQRPGANAIAVAVGDVVGIIDDDAIAPFPRRGSADAGGDPAAGVIVVESHLGILIGGEGKPIPPPPLKPVAVDEPAALDTVARRQRHRVAAIKPASLWVRYPLPNRPEDADGQRFHMPWGDVDQEGVNLAVGDSLQMFADHLEVPTINKISPWFQHFPRLGDKGVQDLLRFEWL
jgi:hypothetical protein